MIERKVSTHIPVGPVNKMLVLTVVRFGRVVIFEKVWMSQISYKGTSIGCFLTKNIRVLVAAAMLDQVGEHF